MRIVNANSHRYFFNTRTCSSRLVEKLHNAPMIDANFSSVLCKLYFLYSFLSVSFRENFRSFLTVLTAQVFPKK